jgi:RNA polymerase sigma factor (sigma-70 family)
MESIPFDHSQLLDITTRALQEVWRDENCNPPPPPLDEQDQHAEAVCRILQKNLTSGRWQRVTGEEVDSTPIPTNGHLEKYAVRIATYYWKQDGKARALLHHDSEAWEELRELLSERAFYMLLKRASLPATIAANLAQDYAHEACKKILTNHYPWDVPFDAWATRILYNCILAGLNRSKDLMDRGIRVDEGWFDVTEQNLSSQEHNPFKNKDDQILLADAIAKIPSETQRQVILLEFFEGWSAERIAGSLGKTPQAVYNLKSRALVNLRRILKDVSSDL